jgi:non-ribosomal peptide synthetase component F
MKAFHVDRELAGQLQKLARQQGATVFMTLLAAFKVLLHRYSAQEDICVGTPTAGRQQQETEELIGFFCEYPCASERGKRNGSFCPIAGTGKSYHHGRL